MSLRVKKIVSAAVRAKRYDVRKLEDENVVKKLSQRISESLAEAHHGQSTTVHNRGRHSGMSPARLLRISLDSDA